MDQRTIIDWLAFSSLMSSAQIEAKLADWIGEGLMINPRSSGWNGYKKSADLLFKEQQIGLIAWGSTHGRNYCSLSGTGCKLLDIDRVHTDLTRMEEEFKPALTRVDIAADFWKGEVTYDKVEEAYATGQFKVKEHGVSPSVRRDSTVGSRGENRGRTIYFGKMANGKEVCCYEKGLEQFARLSELYQDRVDPASIVLDKEYGGPGDTMMLDWFRIEVRYSNSGRILPLDILIDRDSYFAGSYPFCSRVIDLAEGVRPPSVLTPLEAVLAEQLGNILAQYGSTLYTLEALGWTPQEFWDHCKGSRHSKRLVAAGVLDEIDKVRKRA